MKLQIWDTAGQEKFRSIMKTYYKGATGIMLTYSIIDRKSFQNVENWLKQIQINAAADVIVVLVGNKCDLGEREITIAEGQQLAKKHSLEFFETSAKDGTNVNEVFHYLANVIKNKMADNPALKKGIVIGADQTATKMLSIPLRTSTPSTSDGCKC